MEEYSRFAGPEGASRELEGSEIAVLPVPYDKTSTWIKGADKGPFAIIEASPVLELYDPETDYEVYRKGIYTCPPLDIGMLPPGEMVDHVEKEVLDLVGTGKFVVTLGGEHSVSLGPIRAYNAKIDGLSVLQLDAHLDLREEYESSRYNHACVMDRVKEICPVVHAGIRSMSLEEKDVPDPRDVVYARDIMEDNTWIDRVVERLSDDVYVTIDMDVFDPSIVPSTGTPEPGGLNWYQVTALLKAVSERKKIYGFDVVELCPNEYNKAPDYLTAKLVYKFLSYIFSKRN